MLGQVKRVTVAGAKDDDLTDRGASAAESSARERTDQLLLAAVEVDYQENIVREREEGINHIQRDVHKIHELFQDVALHVSQQGETLDHIETNVTSARDQTSQANEQLLAASRRGPSTRRNLLCIGLVLLLILIGILLIKASVPLGGIHPADMPASMPNLEQI